MGRAVDAVGSRFARLVILEISRPRQPGKPVRARCRCDCGNEIWADLPNVRRGNTRSCGCLMREMASERMSAMRLTHGEGHSPLYAVWSAMKQRCEKPSAVNYGLYGARGIRVCDEWQDYLAFRDWAMGAGYRAGLTIDRIDTNGHYEPSNCRWASRTEQARNTRRNHYIEAFGERKLLVEWTQDPRCTIHHSAILRRLREGWSAEDAISVPSYGRYIRKR